MELATGDEILAIPNDKAKERGRKFERVIEKKGEEENKCEYPKCSCDVGAGALKGKAWAQSSQSPISKKADLEYIQGDHLAGILSQ